jgi:dTMP kinase
VSVLITFEGGDGSGKSTQAALLHRRLADEGHDVLAVHEPGCTSLGTYLRDWLKSEKAAADSLSPVAELLLFVAARAQLVAEVIKPALARPDAVVICDRYIDSTVAYQGYGRGLEIGMVNGLNAIALDGAVPDLTLFIDVPPAVALGRVGPASGQDADASQRASRRDEPEGMRRFEQESTAFHERVHQGYVELAKEEPERWRVVDGNRSEDEVADEVRTIAGEVLSNFAPESTVKERSVVQETGAIGRSDSNQPTLF